MFSSVLRFFRFVLVAPTERGLIARGTFFFYAPLFTGLFLLKTFSFPTCNRNVFARERFKHLEEIQTVLQEEQDYLDNIPENLQSSERYKTAQEAVNALEEAEGIIDDIIEYLTSARDSM